MPVSCHGARSKVGDSGQTFVTIWPASFSALHAVLSSRARTRPVCPALKFGVVERDTGTTAGKDEHAGGDQLVTDMSGRAGVPGSGGDAGGFGEDMIATVTDLAELGY